MGIFVALIVSFWLTMINLYLLNKQRQKQRVAVGKPRFITDTSMLATYQEYERGGEGVGALGKNGVSPLLTLVFYNTC
jgi:hypothetical protein